MKKALISFTLLLYMAVSVGMVIHQHYCMGHLYKTTMLPADNAVCTKCGMANSSSHKKGCCHSRAAMIRLHTDQQVNDPLPGLLLHHMVVPPADFFYTGHVHFLTKHETIGLGCRRPRRQPLFTLNCAYLI